MKATALTTLLCLFTCHAIAATDTKLVVIKEVIALSGLRETLEKARLENVELTRKAVLQQPNEYPDHPMMKRLLQRVMEKYDNYSKEIFDYSRREKQYIAFYDEMFTEKEIEGVLEFYKSPSGQALLRAMPTLVSRMQQAGFKELTGGDTRIEQIMRETVEEVQQEFNSDGTPKQNKN